MLDLTSLSNAVNRLGEGLVRYQSDTKDAQIRDGLIQRFEFTYEISHKMLKRHLEAVSPKPEQFDGMPFADLIRTGNEQGLLLGDEPLSLAQIAELREAFQESALPFKVDVLDWHAGSPTFRAVINSQKVLIKGVD